MSQQNSISGTIKSQLPYHLPSLSSRINKQNIEGMTRRLLLSDFFNVTPIKSSNKNEIHYANACIFNPWYFSSVNQE